VAPATPPAGGSEGIVWDGALVCRGCGRRYAIREGVVLAGVLDDAWVAILGEMIQRRLLTEDALRGAPEEERAYDARHAEQGRQSRAIADACFEAVQQRWVELGARRVLDCGAGMMETSDWFARQGAEVVAVEPEISMLRYAAFEGLNAAPLRSCEMGGRTYFNRNPAPFPAYFNRFAADCQRLPFAEGAFDLAFCRATAHHATDLNAAMAEMARVVRPGGHVVLCAEPIRSVLDRESDHLENCAGCEHGLNEHVPTLWNYLRALGRWSDSIHVQYWPQVARFRTRRLFDLLRYPYERHLWPAEMVEGWRRAKLFVVSGGVNLYARRAARRVPAPPHRLPKPAPAKGGDALDEIAEPYFRSEFPASPERIHEDTRRLMARWRALVARRAALYPARVEPGRASPAQLQSGWSGVQGRGGGAFRYALQQAVAILRADAGASRLIVEISGGRPGAAYESRLTLNDGPPVPLSGEGAAWRREAIALDRETLRAGGDRVVVVRIESLRRERLAGTGWTVGPAIRLLAVE